MESCHDENRNDTGGVPRTLPPDLLIPSYQNRLRTIGRHLDLSGHRSITIVEVEGGFIARAVWRRDRDIDLFQFPDDEFPERMILATESRGEGERGEIPSPLAPTGWEDALRAVGRWLDEHHATMIVIAESPSVLIVSGETHPSEGSSELIELLLDPQAMTDLLDQSFRLRGQDQPDQQGDS